jgi:eukaryotic-like serine/threonine-protein kinase
MTERPGAVDGRHLGGRYRMGAPLAAGGMGEVWVARDPLLDRPVAVKVLGGALAGDGRAAERLRREARAAARLDHPNIARVLDLGEHDGRPYLVMELLEGESLAGRIDRAGPTAPGEAARVVAAVADALQAAHRAGVVHRDVKPGNVFLTAEGEVKVLDFGIASAAGEADLTTGDLLGTAAYLAPERALGRPATPAADIYSLGVVLYELLAGRRPFEGGSDIELAMAHVNAHPEPLGLVAPSAPPFLVAACEQAMAKDPAARPRSAAALARLLRSPADAAPATRPVPAVAVPPVTRPPPLPAATSTAPLALSRPGRHRPRSRRRGLLVALLLAVTALAALPAFAGGLVPWVGERPQAPFAVPVPDTTAPADEPATRPADQPGPPAPGPRRPVAGRRPTRPERQRPARPARRRPRPGRRLQRPRPRWRRLRRRRLERPRLSRTGRTGDPNPR